jgi:Holliday junction resolvase RusA-like endonuclease
MTITSQRGRERDPDASWKSVLDGLVHARMLIDDSRKWCKLGDVTFERGSERATTIQLTDIDGGQS